MRTEEIGTGLRYYRGNKQRSPVLAIIVLAGFALFAIGAAYEWSFQQIKPAVESAVSDSMKAIDAKVLAGPERHN